MAKAHMVGSGRGMRSVSMVTNEEEDKKGDSEVRVRQWLIL